MLARATPDLRRSQSERGFLAPASDESTGAGLGHIEVDVGVGNLSGERLVRVRALIDTGATFTVIP